MTPRVALITGASAGLGRVLAHWLGSQGFTLILDARGSERLKAVSAELRALGAAVTSLAGDVKDPVHRRALYHAAEATGRLDLLVNNASTLGPTPLPPLESLGAGDLRTALDVNLIAPLQLVQELLPLLVRSHGMVVNISSDAALGGYPGWGAYGASKAALDLLTVTLAHELSDRGVSVLSVDPGDMRTEMHQAAFPGQDISDRPLPEATLPFWAWLFGQPSATVSGKRFRAQAESWE